MRTHVIQTGRLMGNAAFLRGPGMRGALRRPRAVEFPVLSFVLEHADGLIAIDTGLREDVQVPAMLRRVAPEPLERAPGGMAGAMERMGLDPREVRRIVLTHLDWDHAGGVAGFPAAEVLVHRPEWRLAHRPSGRARYQTRGWPAGVAPTLFDLDDGPYGPFAASREIGSGLRVVPLPGHTAAQVGLVAEGEGGGPRVLFAADHVLRQDWWLEDSATGTPIGLGQFGPRAAVDTSRRLAALLAERPTVLAPSHDDDAPRRLAAAETCAPAAGVLHGGGAARHGAGTVSGSASSRRRPE